MKNPTAQQNSEKPENVKKITTQENNGDAESLPRILLERGEAYIGLNAAGKAILSMAVQPRIAYTVDTAAKIVNFTLSFSVKATDANHDKPPFEIPIKSAVFSSNAFDEEIALDGTGIVFGDKCILVIPEFAITPIYKGKSGI